MRCSQDGSLAVGPDLARDAVGELEAGDGLAAADEQVDDGLTGLGRKERVGRLELELVILRCERQGRLPQNSAAQRVEVPSDGTPGRRRDEDDR